MSRALSKTLFSHGFFVPFFTFLVAGGSIQYPILIPLMGVAVVESSDRCVCAYVRVCVCEEESVLVTKNEAVVSTELTLCCSSFPPRSLKIVFQAIYKPITQLGMVTLLIVFVIFLFTSLAFFETREHYVESVEGDYLWDSKSCDSMLNCFFTMFTFGVIGWADEYYGGSFMGDVR